MKRRNFPHHYLLLRNCLFRPIKKQDVTSLALSKHLIFRFRVLYLVNWYWLLLIARRTKLLNDRLLFVRFKFVNSHFDFSKIVCFCVLDAFKIMLSWIVCIKNSIRIKKILFRIYVWYVHFFNKRIIILLNLIWEVIRSLRSLFCLGIFRRLRGCLWMLAKRRSKFICLIAVHVGSNINLLVKNRGRIWMLVFNMADRFNNWGLLRESYHFGFFIERNIRLNRNMRLLNENLSSALYSFMSWYHLLRGNNLRSFYELNEIFLSLDLPFWVIVSWLLYNLYFMVNRLIWSLFPWESSNCFWEWSWGQINFFIKIVDYFLRRSLLWISKDGGLFIHKVIF